MSFTMRFATLFFTVVSVLLGSCEETQPRGDTGPAPVALAAFAEEAPEAWVYDARTGLWSPSVFTVVVAGTELYRDGRLYRVTSAGLVDRGAVAPEALDAAEETYVAEALHWTPGPDDWVLVLGAHDEAGHVPLRDVRPGDRFAYQGRIFETRASSSGSLDVRHTGEVLSSVEQLRSRRKMRRSRRATTSGQTRGQMVGARPLCERPAEVESRPVPGHWQGDLICGKANTHVVTVVERSTRFTMLL